MIDSVKWQHAFALGVYAIIANDQNEILLVHHIDKDHWMLPGGGVEVGESLTDALKREIEEEASFAIDNVQLFVVNEKPSKKQIIYVFTAKIQKQLPFKTNVETDERKFFSENSLPEKITDSSKQRIQAFFNKITPGSILTS